MFARSQSSKYQIQAKSWIFRDEEPFLRLIINLFKKLLAIFKMFFKVFLDFGQSDIAFNAYKKELELNEELLGRRFFPSIRQIKMQYGFLSDITIKKLNTSDWHYLLIVFLFFLVWVFQISMTIICSSVSSHYTTLHL